LIDAVAAARAIEAAHARGEELVTIMVTSGEAAGQRYLSRGRGRLEGELHDAIDDEARRLADEVWDTRAAVYAEPLFGELHAVAEPLLIFGAGHIAIPLANLALDLGFRVTVLDDREEFAQPARFADGIAVERLDLTDPLRGVEITPRSFVIMLTRAHKHDFDCLRAVLGQPVPPRYIGMIGSKRRVRAAFTALLAGGVAPAQLASVHAPVGVEIGAETPAEIAVSIAAELIQVRRDGTGRSKAHEARVLERMLPEASAQ
jgi:xanthine dehydrogenase accessory factor